MHRFIIFFLALFPALFYAEETHVSSASDILSSAYTPLTTLYGPPETNIFGVNVINGDYNYSCIDFNLPGADPLILQRTYGSSTFLPRGFYQHWSHNLSGVTRCYTAGDDLNVVSSGSLSGEIPFKKRTKDPYRRHDLPLNNEIISKGVTNCGHGEISGRNNIKNIQVTYWTNATDLIFPDGSEHNYHRKIDNEVYGRIDFLESSQKPNGQKTIYKTHGYILTEAKLLTHDQNTANQLIFKHPYTRHFKKNKKNPFFIEGRSDDGKIAKYSFSWHKTHSKMTNNSNILMSKFESNSLPNETYSYTHPDYGPEKLNNRQGEHHRTKIEYYKKGDKMCLNGQLPKEVSSKYIEDRVKRIEVAVKNPDDLQTLNRFTYYRNKDTKEAFTEVYNEYNHLSKFYYTTKDYRLTCLEKYKGTSDYTVNYRERLCFGKLDKEGDLLYKTIENPDGIIHYGENYEYDDRGNVLKRQLHFGTFTDFGINPINEKEAIGNPGWILREDGSFLANDDYCRAKLEGGEIKSVDFTYNKLNLPESEDDGRLKTLIKYCTRNGKQSNLLKDKLFQEKQVTKKREFYDFDENAGCTLRIIDDGSSSERDDLQDVYIRKITRMKNREKDFAGLPLVIDEFGWNGESEQRISRKSLQYDTHGYVESTSIYDAHNQFVYEIQQKRDIQGNVIFETDPLGQTTVRIYNLYRSLREEHGPSANYYMEYISDWLQRPIIETRHCKDRINLTIVRSYDLEGKITKIQDPYGSITEFKYNEHGLLSEVTYPPIRTDKGLWVQPRELKEYNFMGHLVSHTDPSDAVTHYIPNDAGLPLKITYPDGTTEQFRYSIYGEILEKKQRNDSKVIYTYDAFSRPTSETIYDHKGKLLKETSKKYSGLLLLSETDGEGLITSYKYNYAGKISKIYRGSALTKYVYDTLGRLDEEQRYFGKGVHDYVGTKYTYDLLNRITEECEIDANSAIYTKKKTDYDVDSNITEIRTWNHAGTAITKNTYDPRGNLSTSTDPLGNTTHYKSRYDFFLDGMNLPCLEVTDPTGVRTISVSDHKGSVISVRTYSPIGTLLSDTEMFYDIRGNLVRQEQHLSKETITTRYDYDTSSRLIQQVNGVGTPEQITTTFIYNSFGELSKTQYTDGTSKHHSYDGIGRLSEEWSNGKSVHYSYKYNRQDLLTEAENCKNQKKTIKEYSLEGNLLSELFENGLKIGYHYDRLNRATECIYPDGSSVKQAYNPIFLNKSERIKNDVVVYEASFDKFDLSGKPEKVIFPKNSGTLSLKYDKLSRPKRLSSYHYKEKDIIYDSRGLLVSKIVDDDLQKFDHDHLQQLTLEKTSAYSHTYENDALNRQTSIDGRTQTHNAVHQLTQGVHSKYIFDTKGRRTSDSSKIFTYNKFDHLIKIRQGDLTWNYTYDAFHRKMSRTFGGETVYYLYDGHEEIGSYDSALNNLDLKVLSAGEGSIPIAIELGKKNYSPLLSSQGHIVGLVEMDKGKLADKSYLTMFGEDLASNPLSPWRFCGKRHETSELGIIDFGYRFYHPKSAQWLTQDPIGESDGPNLYAYVGNSPTCYIDRYGLFMDDVDFSTSWSNLKNNCSWAGGQVADCTINSPRFCGALQAVGGTSQFMSGACMTGVGTPFTASGLGAPVGVPALLGGMTLMAFGMDNMSKGFYQCCTGRFQDSTTIQLLEKTGMSNGAAVVTEIGLGLLSAKFPNISSSGPKIVPNVISKVGSATARIPKYRPFTDRNYRHNLKELTGIDPKGIDAHHIFPQQFRDIFAEIGIGGINIDDPKYLTWWGKGHRSAANSYNEAWRKVLFESPTPLTKDQIFQEGRNIMSTYGQKVNY